MAKVIKYKYQTGEINHGTEENPVLEPILLDAIVGWNEVNEETAKREAYKGEYTIEDDGQPEPEPAPSGDSVWDELDAAYQRGVDSV